LRKKAVTGTMFILLLMGVLNIVLTQSLVAEASPVTVFSVVPTSITDSTLGPGESFDVDIVISDVTDLGGYEFMLNYSTSVLTTSAADVTIVTDWFSPDGIRVWKKEVDDTLGYVRIIVTLPLGSLVGVDGSGTVVTVRFTVDDYGISVLDLNGTSLGDPFAEPISHETADGYFSNITGLFADLVRRKAWPEHHHYVISKDEDEYQTLHGKAKNLGDQTVWVKLVFNVTKKAGSSSIIETEPLLITPEEIVELSANFGPLTEEYAGKYSVSATCWYSYSGAAWLQGEKEKAFGFSIVP